MVTMILSRPIEAGVLLVSLLTHAVLSPALAQSQPEGSGVGVQVLVPGDHLRITVISDDKNLSGEMEVAPDGTLRHPIYNRLNVGSVPLPLLKDSVASFLRKFEREPQLEVEPLFKTTILGEVRTPSIYFLPPGTTVADAIAHAGGLTDRGDPEKVTILRGGQRLAAPLTGKTANPSLTIQSADQISAPQTRQVMSALLPIIGVAVSILSLILLAHR